MDLTDQLVENVNVTISGTALTVLGKTYTLPKVVMFKQPTVGTGPVIYVTATDSSGAITESVSVDVAMDPTSFVLTATVSYNRYTHLTNGTTLAATSVTIVSGNLIVNVDPTSAQNAGYQGTSFTLNGYILTSITELVGQ